jgi:hypothetical protein
MSQATLHIKAPCRWLFGRESLLMGTLQHYRPTQNSEHWRDHQCTEEGKEVFFTEFAKEIAFTPNYLDTEDTQEGRTAKQEARFQTVLRTLRETEARCLAGRDSEVQECPFEAAMKRFRRNSYCFVR